MYLFILLFIHSFIHVCFMWFVYLTPLNQSPSSGKYIYSTCSGSACSACTEDSDPFFLVILEKYLSFDFPFSQVQTIVPSSFFLKLGISVTPFLVS